MDMKTKLAGLMAQCLTDTWPDAQGLPTAEEIERNPRSRSAKLRVAHKR